MNNINKKGFTLLEILLVVAAIAILAGIVIIAVNPGKQLADTRNAQRRVDVNTIVNAIYQYSIDSKGIIPQTIPAVGAAVTKICKTGVTGNANCIDLSVLTAGEVYITAIPSDPQGANTVDTGYSVVKTANNRITVSAPFAENSQQISVTK